MPRCYGEGEIRIGSVLDLSKDMYTLAYVCLLENEILIQYYDIKNDMVH